jgi:hypothetical protein
MSSSSTPEGPGSASGAPRLPDGFAGTFTSRYIDTGDLRQHVVIGGDGPPLLLVHGWPQTWYAWRLVMPALARHFQVIAPDQRGTGLYASSISDSTPTARTTIRSGAAAIRYSNSAVFPIPASPRSTRDRLSPPRISRISPSSSAHSLARPSRSIQRPGPGIALSIGSTQQNQGPTLAQACAPPRSGGKRS